VVSTRFAGESLFSWIEPDKIRITDGLRGDCLAHKGDWQTRALDDDADGFVDLADFGKMILDERLDKLGKTEPAERKALTEA
ncbi:hypothetical protein ACO1LY_15500, partial [Staphylococcus aureus]